MRQFFGTESVVTSLKGAVGMSATTGGMYVSLLSQVEAWLRIISLLVGITVGVATLISIIRNKNRKNR